MKYKYLFWDLDGTLLNSFEGCANSLQAVYDHFGISLPRERTKRYIGPPLRDSFLEILGDPSLVEEAVSVYREQYIKGGEQWNSKLFDGIPEALAAIKAMGYKMYIATSKGEATSHEIVERYGIVDIFDRIFGADYALGRLTKQEILEYAFDELKCDKSEALMIGDSIYDVRGAKSVGLECLGVSYGFGNMVDMRECGIVGECDSPADLVKYFEK